MFLTYVKMFIFCFMTLCGLLYAEPQITEHPGVQLTEMELENGLKVWLKPTPFQPGEVLVKVIAWGGKKTLSSDQQGAACLAPNAAWYSGLGSMSAEKLSTLLYENLIEFTPRIDKEARVIDASGHTNSLSTLITLVSQWFADAKVTPQGCKEVNSTAKAEDLQKVFDQAFGYPQEFTCIIIGDFVVSPALIAELTQKLGAIPSRTGKSIFAVEYPSPAIINQSITAMEATETFWWIENSFWEGVLGQYALWGLCPCEIVLIPNRDMAHSE